MANTTENETAAIKGGEFLIRETNPQDVFIPAEFNEEQQMMAQTCRDFVQDEVMPLLDRLDNHEEGLMEGLMKKAGELGLFAVSIPEQYGGLNMDYECGLCRCIHRVCTGRWRQVHGLYCGERVSRPEPRQRRA